MLSVLKAHSSIGSWETAPFVRIRHTARACKWILCRKEALDLSVIAKKNKCKVSKEPFESDLNDALNHSQIH